MYQLPRLVDCLEAMEPYNPDAKGLIEDIYINPLKVRVLTGEVVQITDSAPGEPR